jgi:hypothetical protein
MGDDFFPRTDDDKATLCRSQINKHRYSMAKDDVVVGLGRPLYGSSVHATRKKAYPSVITTLGQMEPEARRWLAVHFFMSRSYLDAESIKRRFITVMCHDSVPPGADAMIKEAHTMAGMSPEKRKHIKFQVRLSLDLVRSLFRIRVICACVRACVRAGGEYARILRCRSCAGHRMGPPEQRRHGCICHDRWTQDHPQRSFPDPHKRPHLHLL